MLSRAGVIALLNIVQMLTIEEQNVLVELLTALHKKKGHEPLSGNDVHEIALTAGLIRYTESRPLSEAQTDEVD